jgi:hypothetical protein
MLNQEDYTFKEQPFKEQPLKKQSRKSKKHQQWKFSPPGCSIANASKSSTPQSLQELKRLWEDAS